MRSRISPQHGWLVADYHRGYDVEQLAKLYDLPPSFIEELLEQDVYDWQMKVTRPDEKKVRKVFGDLKSKTYTEDPRQKHIRTKTYWRSLEEIAIYAGIPPLGMSLMPHTAKGNRIGLEYKRVDEQDFYRVDLVAREARRRLSG